MGNASQLTGDVTVAAQGIFSESSSQLHTIGGSVHSNDGRIFRYCKVGGTTLVPGQLYQASAEDTSNMQDLTVTAPAANATSITTTTTVTLAVNLMAGGFLTISSASTNFGQTLRISGNTVASSAVTTIYLDDPVVYAPTGTTKIDMVKNPYNLVVVAPTTATSAAVGFALYKVTNAYFGWLCTYGPTSALAQGTVVVGDDCVPAETTNAGSIVSRADAQP